MVAKSSAAARLPKSRSRRERKKQRTRQEIYRAAMDLLAKQGYDAVTIDAICESADVARGTFFLHFPTKAGLLWEFSRSVAAEFCERRREPRASAIEELRELCRMFAARWTANAELMGAMLREFMAAGVASPPPDDDVPTLPDLIEDIVRRGQRSGELRKSVDPRLAVAMFLSTSAAILSGAVFHPSETTPDSVREQFLEVVLHGLVKTVREPGEQK